MSERRLLPHHPTSVRIFGYRCFESLRVEPLKRVNVIVGKNDAGKTSLLDAIEVMLEPGAATLGRVAERRGEVVGGEGTAAGRTFPDIRYAFFGRPVDGAVAIRFEYEVGSVRSEIESRRVVDRERQERLLWKSNGTHWEDDPLSARASAPELRRALYVGSGLLGSTATAALFGRVSGTVAEAYIVSALQLIEPSVVRLGLGLSPPQVFVGLAGEPDRFPLGHFGEGMSRLFSLSATLALAFGKVVLVDDIDTGLHVSAMAKMWRLVLEATKNLDIQLFATTHSDDCLRGLAAALLELPSHQSDVTLHRLERGADKTVAYDGEEIIQSAERDIEVR